VVDLPLRGPRTHQSHHDHAAVATAVTREDPVMICPEAGFISAIRFVSQALITGVATNTRRLRVINKGQTGAGAVVVGTLQFNAGTNAPAFDEVAIPVDDANDAVAAGDVLSLESAAIGTGLADPGGRLIIEMGRQD
jgi:hypothetical protein